MIVKERMKASEEFNERTQKIEAEKMKWMGKAGQVVQFKLQLLAEWW